MINLQEIGRRVAALRRGAGIRRQEDLANLLGVSRSAIAGIESGGDWPGMQLTVKIADHFKVPLDWLLGRSIPKGGPLAGEFIKDTDELALVHFWRSLSLEQRELVPQLLRIPNGELSA